MVMKFKSTMKKTVEFTRENWISISIIVVCVVLIASMMLVLLTHKPEEKAPIEDIRLEVYQKGIDVCGELTTYDNMVELARIYASGSDIKTSMYYIKMQELETMCETFPEECFFSAISTVIGLNLDAATLYVDHEYELSSEYQAKSAQLFEKLKLAASVDELDGIIKNANAFSE